jgi:hypothetical protein
MSTDLLRALLAPQSLEANLFPPTSRYHGVATASLERDGETLVYLKRRFLPAPEALDEFAQHGVVQGDRLDLLAARLLGDPELFWRLCDGNRALHPEELTEIVGRRLRVTMPQGVPGVGRVR